MFDLKKLGIFFMGFPGRVKTFFTNPITWAIVLLRKAIKAFLSFFRIVIYTTLGLFVLSVLFALIYKEASNNSIESDHGFDHSRHYVWSTRRTISDEELVKLQNLAQDIMFGGTLKDWKPIPYNIISSKFDLSTEENRKTYNDGLETINPELFIGYATEAGFFGRELITFAHIIMCESGMKPHAIGIENPNARGIAQIMHTVHGDLIRKHLGSADKLFEPEASIKLSAILVKKRIANNEPMFKDWSNNKTRSCVRSSRTRRSVEKFFKGWF